MNRNIPIVQNLIRNLDTESLKNPEVVANLVRAIGLMRWVHYGMDPETGPETLYLNPDGIVAIGQTPDQIAKALVYLSDFEINSYCEIGLYYGGNFWFVSEYLRRFNPDIQCVGIDPVDHVSPQIWDIVISSDWMRVILTTSEEIAGSDFDLVFIDGNHTTPWLVNDWENVGRHSKICMFHDLQDALWPDVGAFWAGLNGPKKIEFLDCCPDRATHGIGLIHNTLKTMDAFDYGVDIDTFDFGTPNHFTMKKTEDKDAS